MSEATRKAVLSEASGPAGGKCSPMIVPLGRRQIRSIGVAKLRAARDGPMLGSATQRRRVGADPISFWGTFRCKRPNSTLAASSRFDQPLMIVLASSRILELGARSWKDCRPTGSYLVTRTETRNAGDHAGSPLHLHDCPRALLRCAMTAPVRG